MISRPINKKEMSENVDDEKSFVVMGALTKCSVGTSDNVQLRTEDIGTEDGYGYKILNTDTDKIKNFVDAGVKMHLTGVIAGNLIEDQNDGVTSIEPTKWYTWCTVQNKKCDPVFLPEWFEPSKTVVHVTDFSLALRAYNTAIAAANNAAKNAINAFEGYQNAQMPTIEFWDNFPIIRRFNGGYERTQREKVLQQNISDSKAISLDIDPALSSRGDGASDIAEVNRVLNELKALDSTFAQNQEYTNAEIQIKKAEEALSKLDSNAERR